MACPILTEARRGLWAAIDNWPQLTGAKLFKFKHEDDGALVLDEAGRAIPSPGQLPALDLYPLLSEDGWRSNQTRNTMLALGFSLWTQYGNILKPEKLWQQIVQALFQSKPENGVEYWRASDVVQNMTVGAFVPSPAPLEPTSAQSPVATRWDWPVTLEIVWNPRLGVLT